MIISFDLDDTIISKTKFPLEKETFFHRILGIERIRLGTRDLFKELKARGHKIYIYTTSFRSKSKISLMFYSYGIPVDYIINQQKHTRNVKDKNISKFPPQFGIDIHIDDSLGVKMEGEKHGFNSIIISEKDKNWAAEIIKNLESDYYQHQKT